jgi:hypothetical protein
MQIKPTGGNVGVGGARLSNHREHITARHVEGESKLNPMTVLAHNTPRCIPKMDHHCPWTSNCVSHFTFPHFIRFLFYAVVGMSYLETLLFERASIVWKARNLPSVRVPLNSVGN